jgi:putative DNA primase/helicase
MGPDSVALAALSSSGFLGAAAAMRERYPAARLLILGDAGNGEVKAREAAEALAAALAVPAFTAEQKARHQERTGKEPTDFNDLAARAGLAEVRRQIEAAGPVPEAEKTALPRGYRLTEKGVFFVEEAKDENDLAEERKVFVCGPLRVTAETRTKDQTGWGRLLEWRDRDGHPHAWTLPMSMLEGDAAAVCAVLADRGLITGNGTKARQLLTRYLKECRPAAKLRSTDRTGWYGNAYVLPSRTIGEADGERVLYQTGTSGQGDFRQRGTAADWRATVARLCAGNTRPMFGIGFAFAAPLLRFAAGEESGGAHFRGDSSCGKSTILCAAASVWGKPSGDDSFRKEWRATGNGLEALAQSRNDSLLPLDEMGQVDGKEAGNIAYMLANGQAKQRMSDQATLRRAASWRLLFLSSGEISLADHMAAAGKTIKAGQESRLADIPAAPFTGYGVFDTLNGYPDGAALSVAIRDAAAKHYGAVGIAYLEYLARVQDAIPGRLKAYADQFGRHVVQSGASGQVDRVAKRFALVGFALELAQEFGLTGWEPGEGTRAAKVCFNAWLHHRGGPGDLEEAAILAQTRAFFEAHGDSRFADWDHSERAATGIEEVRRIVLDRVGFRRRSVPSDGWCYFVLAEQFRTVICQGLDHRRAAEVLRRHGWIEPDRDGRNSQSLRLPGMGRSRAYVFTPKMWESP